MNPNTFPTKGNLILAKNSLALAKQGYVLMDKKRNILIREPVGDRLLLPRGLRVPPEGQHRAGHQLRPGDQLFHSD